MLLLLLRPKRVFLPTVGVDLALPLPEVAAVAVAVAINQQLSPTRDVSSRFKKKPTLSWMKSSIELSSVPKCPSTWQVSFLWLDVLPIIDSLACFGFEHWQPPRLPKFIPSQVLWLSSWDCWVTHRSDPCPNQLPKEFQWLECFKLPSILRLKETFLGAAPLKRFRNKIAARAFAVDQREIDKSLVQSPFAANWIKNSFSAKTFSGSAFESKSTFCLQLFYVSLQRSFFTT